MLQDVFSTLAYASMNFSPHEYWIDRTTLASLASLTGGFAVTHVENIFYCIL